MNKDVSKPYVERYNCAWSQDSIRYINTPTPIARQSFFYVQEAGVFLYIATLFHRTSESKQFSYHLYTIRPGNSELYGKGIFGKTSNRFVYQLYGISRIPL